MLIQKSCPVLRVIDQIVNLRQTLLLKAEGNHTMSMVAENYLFRDGLLSKEDPPKSYAAINFIQNHSRDTTRRGQNPPLGTKQGGQKPHTRDIKLRNFTNVFINTLTLFEMKTMKRQFFNEETVH